MDVDASLCVKICCQDAEAEFFEEFLGGVRIDGFEFLDPLLNFYLNGAVFKVVDGRKQVVHIFSASEWVSGKTKWRM